jgi:hypothetical protein
MKVFYVVLSMLSAECYKFCTNCKYYRPSKEFPTDTTMGKCGYFPTVYNETYNVRTGELIASSSDYEWCRKARNWGGLCGTTGKYFTPKNMDSEDCDLNSLCDM